MKPYARTATRRRRLVGQSRKALARWAAYMDVKHHNPEDPQTAAGRISALLWARAFIDQVLAIETRGILGDMHATPARTLSAAGLTMEAILNAKSEETA